MTELSVMTVDHPKWEEFTERLEGPEGCNFQQKVPGDAKSTTWKCSSGPDYALATPILKAMGCDVEKSIAFFREHGGYCDCEVLFNVERSVRRLDRRPVRKRRRVIVKAGKKKRTAR